MFRKRMDIYFVSNTSKKYKHCRKMEISSKNCHFSCDICEKEQEER